MAVSNWAIYKTDQTPISSTRYTLLYPCDLPSVFCESIVILERYAFCEKDGSH